MSVLFYYAFHVISLDKTRAFYTPIKNGGITILLLAEWQKVAKRLVDKNVAFDLAPSVRFEDLVGEK